jgi:CheY-like chemotaxis protein
MRFTRPADPALRTLDLAVWLPTIVSATLQGFSTRVELDIPSSPLYAEIDPQQLEQVIANLLLNARESLTDGHGCIRVALTGHDGAVQIGITDDGNGILGENLEKLFEPFFTTKRSGTGLGLPVARQIVERHHGTIEVESRGPNGTTFTVTLPLAPLSPALPAQLIERTIRGRQLLLVEDEEAVADGILALLHEGEATARLAPTGRHAVAALEQEIPEAILLDVGLPDIDGVDLFALMRRQWPKVPIVFSTGHGDQARLDEMLRLPHVGHLVKPFDLADLTTAVANAIAG